MKVKQRGINPSNWKKDVRCPHCQTLLEITVKDISIRTEANRNFWGNKKITTYFRVKCSECNGKFRILKENLPERIIDYLYDHRDPNDFLTDFLHAIFHDNKTKENYVKMYPLSRTF